MLIKKGILYGCLFLFCQLLVGQDLHYSQFFNSPLNLNPGLTGVFNGDLRFAGNYRRQWKSVPVDYMSFTGSFDMKFPSQHKKGNFWSGGLLFNYDQSGELSLSLTKIAAAASYTFAIDKKNLITPGILFGFNQGRIKFDNILTGNQWQDGQFNPGIAPEIPDQDSRSYGNISAGINYRWQSTYRTHIDFGFGFYNIFSPKQTYQQSNDDGTKLRNRLNYTIQGSFEVADKLDILGFAHLNNQGPDREWLLNGQAKIYLNKSKDRDIALLVGLGIRLNDAAYPMIGIQHKNIQAAFSYDVNFSDFNIATENKGGPELSFIYKIWKVPKADFKPCPIY